MSLVRAWVVLGCLAWSWCAAGLAACTTASTKPPASAPRAMPQGDAGASVTPDSSGPHVPDIAAVGEAGQARALAPILGKVTVFDFWAPWCEPCKAVRAGLHELAASSQALAVRTLQIEDIDDPAAVAYLNAKGFTLPHLKIYDAQGRLLGERSGPASDLLPWLRGMLPAPPPANGEK